MQLVKSGSTPYLSYADYDNGKQAITAYHNEMIRQFPDVYHLKLDELIEGLTIRKGQKYFLDGLGLGITNAGLSPYQVRQAMKTFVSKSGGKIPASNGAFYGALTDEAQVFSLVDASTFTFTETAKQIGSGVANVGNKVIGIGEGVLGSAVSLAENLKFIIPLILIVGVGVYVYGNTKK